ncbi:MAG: DEAD/DEAH box helicase, partial [Bacteroidota bacterium]
MLTEKIPESSLEVFNKDIVPLLREKMPRASHTLQKAIIQYFTANAPIHADVLRNYPPDVWIRESLLLDITRYDTTQLHDSVPKCLRAYVNTWRQRYGNQATLQLLSALKKQQQAHPLALETLCEALAHLPIGSQAALAALRKPDWLPALRKDWLLPHLQALADTDKGQNNNQQVAPYSQEIAQLPWSTSLLESFLKRVQQMRNIDDLQEFLAFAAQYPGSEAIIQAMLNHMPPEGTHSIAQGWKQYLAQSLLKNKLQQRYPQQLNALTQQLLSLYEQRPTNTLHKAIYHFLAAVPTTGASEAAARQLSEVLHLLHSYNVDEPSCTSVFTRLQGQASHRWQSTAHQAVVASTFKDAHELTVDEVIEQVVSRSPEKAHLANSSYALRKAYDEVMAAFRSTSAVLSSQGAIESWDKAAVKAWSQKMRAQLQESRAKDATAMSSVVQQEIIAVVMRAVKLHNGFSPRATQLLSVLCMLNPTENLGRLAQINTGEGKSLIVAMLAAIRALQGHKVDVVTTSTELSVPEVEEQTPFFEMLSLSVGENSAIGGIKEDADKKKIYAKDIVYGITGDFHGDILRTEFFGRDIRGDRGFGVVIVDEVDSMLFDSRTNSTRLSGPMPAMNHLEELLAAIWNQVSNITTRLVDKDGKTFFAMVNFKVVDGQITIIEQGRERTLASEEEFDQYLNLKDPIEDKEKFITKHTTDYVEQLLRPLYGDDRETWETYRELSHQMAKLQNTISALEHEIAEETGSTKSREEKEKKEKEAQVEALAKNLQAAQVAWGKKHPIIEIPKHLRGFTKKQIPQWIHSALCAMCCYHKEKHYDVRHKRRIVPIDYNNTGVLQNNLVWSQGLAQFLQIKEGLPIQPESISTNFISTVGFFKRYGAHLYGLTGTLGNSTTQGFFTKMYNTDMVVIPPYKKRTIIGNEQSRYICKELPAVISPKEESWYEAVCQSTLRAALQRRAVLVLCKYIHQVKEVCRMLYGRYDRSKLRTYTGQAAFGHRHMNAGDIVVATNIAGRGTDLKPSEMVEANGGLHVNITFLPASYRVELQNAGRTARKGQRGTAQLTLCHKTETDIMQLRTARDAQEAEAIEGAEKDVKTILFKDKLFKRFCALKAEILPKEEDTKKIQQRAQIEEAWKAYQRKNIDTAAIER